ncbi:hypothetical protein OIDMADRAFT_141678 [Oidiodendron maius Zn]|uniref:Uncharacterized protein n=1 Tax=Oidiodendron maius (strain Zn) TaxID=913774 RepID=A0A0C3D430_OIDMZ|nr:hypothetical protein OIDMADRAFT_141678 [Oidiodendron maius Zn]
MVISLTMMDDSMEISSEYGHNIRDEDIDIDIDLTTGHGDEDYILEDALPHQTADEEFLFQASPTPGNDDLMVDEEGDNETYYANEIAPDLVQDKSNKNMVEETGIITSMAANSPTTYQEHYDALDAGHVQAASVTETAVASGHKDAPNGYTANNNLDLQSYDDPATHEDEDSTVTGNAADIQAEAVTVPAVNIHSPPPSAHSRSPKSPQLSEHPTSPLNTLPKSADESQEHIVTRDQLDTVASHEYEEGLHSEPGVSYPTDGLQTLPIPEILVLYQETEYALFSTSELDDPDSFFLSDTSILNNPISDFLKAIRNVIHDDLANEDELCLSIGDMGIEVEEVSLSTYYSLSTILKVSPQTSTLIQDVTLRQILNLYEGLLRNDGVDSPQPFCVQLGVRPNFAKRLANLAAGFTEGKGLSELVSLAEHSNSPGASLEMTGNKHGDDAKTEELDRREVDKEHEDVQDNSEISQTLVPDTDLKSPNPVGSPSDKSTTKRSNELTTVLLPEDESSQTVGGNGINKYEEDLIDYSDEEAEQPEKHTKHNVVVSEEEFSLDSVPVSTKDSLPEQSVIAHVEPSDVDDNGQEEPGVEYEEHNEESYYLESEFHEDVAEESAIEAWEHEGNNQLVETQNGLKSNEKSQDSERDPEDPEDDIGYDEGHDADSQDLLKLSDEDLGLEGSPEKPLEDEHDHSRAVGNTVSSENGTSDKTLEASAGADEVSGDEIDYDDNDDPVTPEIQEFLSSEKDPVQIDSSGKRQREDANLDEGMNMRSKRRNAANHDVTALRPSSTLA